MGRKGLFAACFGSQAKENADTGAAKANGVGVVSQIPTPPETPAAATAKAVAKKPSASSPLPPSPAPQPADVPSASGTSSSLRPESRQPVAAPYKSQESSELSHAQERPKSANIAGNSFTSNSMYSGDQPDIDNPYSSLPVNTLGLMTLEALAHEIQQLTWIGQGGLGTVYKGIWQGAPVAVKFMCTNSLDLTSATAREAVLSKLLSHPNVVQTFASKVAKLDDNFFTAIANFRGTSKDTDDNTTSKITLSTECRDSFVSGEGFGNPLEKSKESTNIRDVLFHVDAKPGDYLTQIVMEYCDKGSLQQAINKGLFKPSPTWSSRLALRAYLRTAREVAQGMCHIHKSNVIHGDLKPGNVLLKGSRLDRRGFIAKVSDFGLSRVCDKSVVDASNWGTIGYMAPEAFEDQLTRASDVYSFGVLLWEMYVGERPYVGLHPGQIVVGVQTGELRPVWPQDAPFSVVDLSKRCLVQDHNTRPNFEYIMKQLRVIESEVRMEKHKEHSRARRSTADPNSQDSASWRIGPGAEGSDANQMSRESKVSLYSGSDKASLYDDEDTGSKARALRQ